MTWGGLVPWGKIRTCGGVWGLNMAASGSAVRPSHRRRDRQQEPAVSRFEPNLRIPGPTALPPSVREAGARQMINHRGPEFAAMLARILDRLKPYFGTTSDLAMITTAGNGGLQAPAVHVPPTGASPPRPS